MIEVAKKKKGLHPVEMKVLSRSVPRLRGRMDRFPCVIAEEEASSFVRNRPEGGGHRKVVSKVVP